MKNINLLLLLTVVIFRANSSFAKTFTNSPNDTVVVSAFMEDYETLTIFQSNISGDSILLQWEKVSETVPANWEASVCDNRVCYTELVDSGIMNPIAPATSAYLLAHVTAHVNYGTAVIRYAVWDAAYPLQRDTLTFIVVVNAISRITESEHENTFSIFPNPVVNDLHIVSNLPTGFIFSVADLSGKEVYAGTSNANSISLSSEKFSKGEYIVSFSDKGKNIQQLKFIKP